MKHPQLTERQAEVVERVAKGLPDKRIAAELRISVYTVRRHIQDAATRIPGDSSPRHRLTLFFLNVVEVASQPVADDVGHGFTGQPAADAALVPPHNLHRKAAS